MGADHVGPLHLVDPPVLAGRAGLLQGVPALVRHLPAQSSMIPDICWKNCSSGLSPRSTGTTPGGRPGPAPRSHAVQWTRTSSRPAGPPTARARLCSAGRCIAPGLGHYARQPLGEAVPLPERRDPTTTAGVPGPRGRTARPATRRNLGAVRPGEREAPQNSGCLASTRSDVERQMDRRAARIAGEPAIARREPPSM